LAHVLAACSISAARADIGNRGAWGDRGDGTYLNPILPGDYSDIDAIRVGDDYYAISSTLHLSPGMAVLHSRDLVNWTIISHAVEDVTQIGPELNWDRMNRYGRGVWAGAIRYHDEATLEVDIGGMADGQVAGLCHFASTYGWLGVRQENGRRTLVFNNNGSPTEGPKIEVDRLWLRSTWDQDGVSRFSYSVDGESFAGFGETYQLTWGHYRGDRVGAFTCNNRGEVGFLDVDAFRYEFSRSSAR
jgi:beta-xylosidase